MKASEFFNGMTVAEFREYARKRSKVKRSKVEGSGVGGDRRNLQPSTFNLQPIRHAPGRARGLGVAASRSGGCCGGSRARPTIAQKVKSFCKAVVGGRCTEAQAAARLAVCATCPGLVAGKSKVKKSKVESQEAPLRDIGPSTFDLRPMYCAPCGCPEINPLARLDRKAKLAKAECPWDLWPPLASRKGP